MKFNIIDDFTEENINLNEKNITEPEKTIRSSQSDIMKCINKYIIKVKNLFYVDRDLWGNRIIDVLITELQTRHNISYEKAENHVLKCVQDNNLPKPNRAKYNYNICRELNELPELQITL